MLFSCLVWGDQGISIAYLARDSRFSVQGRVGSGECGRVQSWLSGAGPGGDGWLGKEGTKGSGRGGRGGGKKSRRRSIRARSRERKRRRRRGTRRRAATADRTFVTLVSSPSS